jgi:hypothetical protein
MNAKDPAMVSRIVSSIPERTARNLSGTVFSVEGARACSDPARLVNVARLLQWLSPLSPLTGDDQRNLGLHANLAVRTGQLPEENGADDGDEPGDDPAVEQEVQF